MANSPRRPPKKRSDFAYGTQSYFDEREKRLRAQQRALRLSVGRGSKKAARRLRETDRLIAATRERADRIVRF